MLAPNNFQLFPVPANPGKKKKAVHLMVPPLTRKTIPVCFHVTMSLRARGRQPPPQAVVAGDRMAFPAHTHIHTHTHTHTLCTDPASLVPLWLPAFH
jgi:hypothetical protein